MEEIIHIEIPEISSSIDYLELLMPTSYKIIVKLQDTILQNENGGVFQLSFPGESYQINLSYSLYSDNNTENLITEICNNSIDFEFYKIINSHQDVKIGQNSIKLQEMVYSNLEYFEEQLDLVSTVPIVLNIKPIYLKYNVLNKIALNAGIMYNFIKMSFMTNINIENCKIGFFYPVNGEFRKKIILNADNTDFFGFINETDRLVLVEGGLNDKSIAIEFKNDERHYIGFLMLSKFLEPGVIFNTSLQLFEFNWNALKSKCNYQESVFKGRELIVVEKKQNVGKSTDKKSKKVEIVKPEMPQPLLFIPILDEENIKVDVECNISFKYPLVIRGIVPELADFIHPDEEEDNESAENELMLDSQSLIMSRTTNPQQIKDNLIRVILPVLEKTGFIDIPSTDRTTSIYFKLKHCIAEGFDKLQDHYESETICLYTDLLYMANEFHEMGEIEQCNRYYLKYLMACEFSEKSLLNYIAHSLSILDFEKAQYLCRRLLNLNDSNVTGLLVQSYLEFKLNNYLPCETILLKITKIQPNFIHALVIYYLIQIRTEKHSQLNRIAGEISKWVDKSGQENSRDDFFWTQPTTNDTFLKSSIFFIKLGCFEYAEMGLSYNQLVNDNLRHERFYLLSTIDYAKGNYRASLNHLNKCQQLEQIIPKLKFNILYKLKEYDSCIELFRNMNDLEPLENRQYNLKLGWYFNSTQKFDAAKTYLDEIPDELSTLFSWLALGQTLMGLEQWDDAEKCFIRANSIDKMAAEPWKYLAVIYEHLDREPQARICQMNYDMVSKRTDLPNK